LVWKSTRFISTDKYSPIIEITPITSHFPSRHSGRVG
jgi:hypothetical protein